MPHSQLDVFGQWRILDAATFGSNWFSFQHQFAQMEQREVYIRGGKGKPGQKPPKRRVWTIARDADGQPIYRNTERLQAAIEPLCFRVTDAVLDLPPVVDEQVYCLLDQPTLRVYQNLEDDFCAELSCGEIAASNHLSRLLRLSQVANGFGVDALTGEIEELSSAKADLLADVLADLSPEEPVVVFGRFHHDLDAIADVAKAAGRGYHEVSGRINQLAAWQAGAGNLLGVQLQAGGVGVDLTRARYQVYFSLDFNLGNYLQTRKRIHRPGQTRSVTYIHLLAAGTVDETILSALQQRRDVVTAVVDALQDKAGVLA
jgi:SNF2 family DNA or RNA helicase